MQLDRRSVGFQEGWRHCVPPCSALSFTAERFGIPFLRGGSFCGFLCLHARGDGTLETGGAPTGQRRASSSGAPYEAPIFPDLRTKSRCTGAPVVPGDALSAVAVCVSRRQLF
ncbi:hypothetical protein cyc_05529 [Cyclospora cayetanensis]|uniref:Uncharacterized protein n=1 Tax=Cyclospora cayetanensis TaxID=88456 RepID=A0A1D3CSQ6_9EIME|nr:hypothetical protein cyc_05529 [Cyclospora cayetanensis]